MNYFCQLKKIPIWLSIPLTTVILLGGFLVWASVTQGQSNGEGLETVCQLDNVDRECNIISQEACQQLLEKCKAYYENASVQLEQDIQKTKTKEKSYQNEVYLLSSRITQLKNQIYQSNLIVKDLGLQIQDTETSIDKTSIKISDIEDHLVTILRTVYEEDQKSLMEILLAEDNFSDFFSDIMSLEVLGARNQELLDNIKELKSYLEEQKKSLDGEKEDLERQVLIQRLQQQEGEQVKQEKEYLLAKVQGEKAAYEEYLDDVNAKAQEIRKRIFRLAQIPESEAPTLEEAYALAKYVEGVTGVRPAFLMGLLQVESRIGQNVGQCNCSYCQYPDISWKTVMSKTQWPSFLKVTAELGMDEENVPVSCWVGNGKVQMGGAMGPAQFMPSTWLDLGYKERIEAITGNKPANPWRVQDAFLAAGLYLSDWGADSQKMYDEIGAATAYLCGTSTMTSRCIKAGGKAYVYGWTDSSGQHHSGIMDYAAEFQDYIDSGVFD